MEIKETLEENSGRDSGGKFLSRGKLPKVISAFDVFKNFHL